MLATDDALTKFALQGPIATTVEGKAAQAPLAEIASMEANLNPQQQQQLQSLVQQQQNLQQQENALQQQETQQAAQAGASGPVVMSGTYAEDPAARK